MNDTKKLLFTVTDGIADEYLAEAATTRLIFPTRMVKRVVAVAAMIAILLTCLLWNPATETPAPALAIRVFAAENGEQTVTVGSDPIPIDGIFSTDACEHSFPDDWDPDGFFFFRICKAESFPRKFFSEVKIEHDRGGISTGQVQVLPAPIVQYTITGDGKITKVLPVVDIGSMQDKPSHLNVISISGGETIAMFSVEDTLHPEDAHICIHGKLKETTEMKIKLYVPQDGQRKLYQSVTVRVNVSAMGYTLEVTDITINEQ